MSMPKGTVRKNKYKMKNKGCGVGYFENYSKKDNIRIYNVWTNMLKRCYDEKCRSYKTYGSKGVKVCDEWHLFDNFFSDFKNIDGYDEELFNNGLLRLDKDKKQIGSNEKLYSILTCEFVSEQENTKIKIKENSIGFIATSPDGIVYKFTETSMRSFCIEKDIPYKQANNCFNGYQKTCKGWKFEKLGDDV